MYRGRRLRKNQVIRSMMKETVLTKRDLIYPLFVVEGENICREIETLPGVYHYSIDRLCEALDEMRGAQVLSCILFGIPNHKDACGTQAYAQDGIVQRAIRFIKSYAPEIYVIGDVCMCEYTDHGHCGILNAEGDVMNDETLSYLNRIALSYAQAGIDMVAPSDMMDGHIASIRQTLDSAGFQNVAIMGYSAKYASSFYGPFRAAANSAPSFGDRKGYQMDYANREEALRELQADVDEGADVLMVKRIHFRQTLTQPLILTVFKFQTAHQLAALSAQLLNIQCQQLILCHIDRYDIKVIHKSGTASFHTAGSQTTNDH